MAPPPKGLADPPRVETVTAALSRRQQNDTLTNLLLALALARIIAGEAPGCDIQAKLAVAHVHSRNDVWFGDAEPTAIDLYVALHWQEHDDPTSGAMYLIHPTDRSKMPWLAERTASWTCDGTELEAWN